MPGRRVGESVGALLPDDRIEIGLVVEVGRRAPGAEQQTVGAVAAGDEAAVAVDVRHVGSDLEIVEDPVGAVEPDRDPVELVVVAGDDAAIVIVAPPDRKKVVRSFPPEMVSALSMV